MSYLSKYVVLDYDFYIGHSDVLLAETLMSKVLELHEIKTNGDHLYTSSLEDILLC